MSVGLCKYTTQQEPSPANAKEEGREGVKISLSLPEEGREKERRHATEKNIVYRQGCIFLHGCKSILTSKKLKHNYCTKSLNDASVHQDSLTSDD